MVAFCGRILALGRWNLQMSRCKCPGAPRGQPPGMAADKCIIFNAQARHFNLLPPQGSSSSALSYYQATKNARSRLNTRT